MREEEQEVKTNKQTQTNKQTLSSTFEGLSSKYVPNSQVFSNGVVGMYVELPTRCNGVCSKQESVSKCAGQMPTFKAVTFHSC